MLSEKLLLGSFSADLVEPSSKILSRRYYPPFRGVRESQRQARTKPRLLDFEDFNREIEMGVRLSGRA